MSNRIIIIRLPGIRGHFLEPDIQSTGYPANPTENDLKRINRALIFRILHLSDIDIGGDQYIAPDTILFVDISTGSVEKIFNY